MEVQILYDGERQSGKRDYREQQADLKIERAQCMKVRALKLVCFSPTGTTRSVVQAIARGMAHDDVELIDITNPEARTRELRTSESELLVVGVPVYIGRVPALLSDWLHAVKAERTPVVCVVVYGNRAYEDALLELRDTLKECGGVPIACAAFVGEHSFSSPDTPIAVARPDAADLRHAEMFGRRIGDALQSMSSVDHVADIDVPGSYPYRHLESLLSVDFIDVDERCAGCGVCAESCPVGAIDFDDSSLRDKQKCILCCACIKRCPEKARTMKAGVVKDIAVRVSRMCSDRREPVIFL